MVHFNTNGLLLNEEKIKKIIDLKIDSIKFSFQGIDDLTYGEMRNGGSFSRLFQTIKTMYEMRGEKRDPYISISTSTTYESEEDIMSFKRAVLPYCDEVNIGKTKMQHVDVGRMNLTSERREVYEQFIKNDKGRMRRSSVCSEIWDKLSVNWDGSVSACCSDYDNIMLVGNIMENNLQEIFLGMKEMQYREILKEDAYDRLPLCRNCYEYIPLKR